MNWLAMAVILLAGMLMVAFTIAKRKPSSTLRDLKAFSSLHHAIGRAVEEGGRLHLSLGHGGIITAQSASTLAGLVLLRRAADLTVSSDKAPVATSGESLSALLSQDLLKTAYQAATGLPYQALAGRLSGLTPFSYAAGALPVIYDEQASANILLGHFGPEVALLSDAAERKGAFTLGGSDALPAQAVLYLTAQEPLIGEDLFAAPAYLQPSAMHLASLRVQDVLRWVIILTALVGALLRAGGIL